MISYFNIAKRISKKSNHRYHKIGAVIVKNRKVISTGYNKCCTHPKSNTPFKQIHAEFHAVSGFKPYELEDSEIYVYRQHKSGTLALSKPCKFCEKYLRLIGIKKVYYTTENGTSYIKF